MSTNSTILPVGAQSLFPSNLRGNIMPSLYQVMCSAIPCRCTQILLSWQLTSSSKELQCDPRATPLPNPWSSKHISKGVAKVGLYEEAPSDTKNLHEKPCIFLPQKVWELSTLSSPVFPRNTVASTGHDAGLKQQSPVKKPKPTGSWDLVVFSFTGLQRDHSFLYCIYSALCRCYPGKLFPHFCSKGIHLPTG